MTNVMDYYSIGDIVVYLILVLIFSWISVHLGQQAQQRQKNAEHECAIWHDFCERLYKQVRSDHTGMMSMVWDLNEEQKALMYPNKFDLLMYEAGQALKDFEKNTKT